MVVIQSGGSVVRAVPAHENLIITAPANLSPAVDNTALARASIALAAAITAMRPPPPQIVTSPFLDQFTSTNPFDLSSRAGACTYQLSSSPLDKLWDGAVASFPSFVVSLRARARQGIWNTSAPQGILEIGGQEILTNYYSITHTEIEIACTTHINT